MSDAVRPSSTGSLGGRLRPRPAERAAAFAAPSELEDWIAAWLAPKLGMPAAEIDRHAAFTDYGLDSMVAVKLSGDLEKVLRQPVSPAVAWEYPTIAEVAAHLLSAEAPLG